MRVLNFAAPEDSPSMIGKQINADDFVELMIAGDFATAFENYCDHIPAFQKKWIWISEAGRMLKENGRSELDTDQTKLKRSLPGDIQHDHLSGGSSRRVKRCDLKVKNKMRTFLYFDPDADYMKCYDAPSTEECTRCLNNKFSLKDILHPELFEKRDSWNNGLAARLFPAVTTPILNEDGRIIDEVQGNQSAYDAAKECHVLLRKASLDLSALKCLIYGWDNFDREIYGNEEVDRMLEMYQRKCGVLSLSIELMLQVDATDLFIDRQWQKCITSALQKLNECGMHTYKPNQSERTIRNAWASFRVYRLFPNTVEDRVRGGPPFLRANPDVQNMMKMWGNSNLKSLHPGTFREHLVDVALPAYVQVLIDEANERRQNNQPTRLPGGLTPETLTVDSLLEEYGVTRLSITTVRNWMDFIG